MSGTADPSSAPAPAALETRYSAALSRLTHGGPLVVAVSGGADSVAAARLTAATGRAFVMAHFDHALRAESADDAAFVAELANELGATLHRERVDVLSVATKRGWNLEDAARRLRYAFLHRVLKSLGGNGEIVVAHTLDDQAETFLLQLLRGAAYPVGMAERRGAVVRPLLEERRQTLRAYLHEVGSAWREDATNQDLTRNRAWVRGVLLPLMEERWAGAAERIATAGEEIRGAREAIEELARLRFGDGDVRTAELGAAGRAVGRMAIASRLRALDVPPTARLVTTLEAAVRAAAEQGPAAPPWRMDVGRGVRVEIAYGRMRVARGDDGSRPPPGERLVSDPADLPAGVDPDVLSRAGLLSLRSRRPGDRIRLEAGSKSVSDLLIDRKIPAAERDSIPLLADGPNVLWIEGVAAAPGVMLEPQPGLSTGAGVDCHFMGSALAQARLAAAAGEVPVGAVVVLGGEVIARAHNLTEALSDPTAHAELLAVREAAQREGDWRLANATLYVTLEPCPMCMGALLQAQLGRLVYGAPNLREGALGGVIDLRAGEWKDFPTVVGGVRAAAAAELLAGTFRERRTRRG